MEQILENLGKVGAQIDDVTRFVVYIKQIGPEKILEVAKAVHAVTKHIPEEQKAASTYVGVTALAHPKMLLELEATAQVPAPDHQAATGTPPGAAVNMVHMDPYLTPVGQRYSRIV